MKGIVAIDADYNIGYKNKLLYHIKNDMKFFKDITTNKVVVMGRKTFDSLKEPLKNRLNLVISNSIRARYDNVIIDTLENINTELKKYDTNDVFIIGGSSVYKEFLNRCDTFYVTSINKAFKNADTKFPNLPCNNFNLVENIESGDTIINDKCVKYYINKWIINDVDPLYKAILTVEYNHKIFDFYTPDFKNLIYLSMNIENNKYILDNIFCNKLLLKEDRIQYQKIASGVIRSQYKISKNDIKCTITSFGGSKEISKCMLKKMWNFLLNTKRE